MTLYQLVFISLIKHWKALFILILLSPILTGCGKDDNSNKSYTSTQQKIQKYSKDTVLKGKVSNEKGPLSNGEITVTDSKGKAVTKTRLENDNHYSLTIPAGTELPITLSFTPTDDSSSKEKLISVVIYASITKYDITELTTLIAKTAKSLGGYTHANMVRAAANTVGVPDANKTSSGFRGDPTKQYGGWH